MIFETHAHYDDEAFDEDREKLLETMHAQGIEKIINVGASLQGVRDTVALTEKYPFVYGAVGIHPDEVGNLTEEDMKELRGYCDREKIAAIGEIGLDYHYEEGYSPSALQEPWFRRQLRLAKELDKPVVIHARDAWDKVFDILDEEGMREWPLLWHCFGGDAARAAQIMERGWYIAFGGASTFKANSEVREALHLVLPERLMLETDCPYLAPVPWRGKTNEPALTVFTAECLAGELGMSMEDLWMLAGANTRRFFGMQKND